jgi:hypothetical protein
MNMAGFNRKASLLVAAGLCAPVLAWGASGQFTFVVGEVTLQKAGGQRVAARAGADVDPGDTIVSGANGMAQLTMVDNARLAVRPNTTFRIDNYPARADSEEGALLNLVRGTLRTFTGLIAARNKDKFAMKTRVATVGIRGSGNILYACSGSDCDPGVGGGGTPSGDFTVNHTIEGSHAITNILDGPPGVPPQQGGPTTLITGPGQTVLVQGQQPPRYIPTPRFIADSANNMTSPPKAGEVPPPPPDPLRNFAPGDARDGIDNNQTGNVTAGGNGLGFPLVDASGNLASDPARLQDIVMVAGGPFLGQAAQESLVLDGNALRAYTAYRGSQSNITPTIVGGTARDIQSFSAGTSTVTMGRWENASLGLFGANSAQAIPGSIHWVYAGSGFPTYLSDVLTGSVSYTLAAATAPTNQNNVVGALGSATLNVNFTNRTLNAALGITMPSSAGAPAASWSLNANNVPFALNTFYASTGGRLVITNGAGQSSATNSALSGSVEGSFVGASLQGAILGYGFSDQTPANATSFQSVSGVVGFTGPAQDGAAPFRDGLVSDPAGSLSGATFGRSYATVDRPDEVTTNAAGAVTAFAAPQASLGAHARYALGTASVAQSGVDAETGLSWGRWSGGTATVTANGQTQNISLASASLHYIFGGAQSGPVALPLTGTGVYDVIGSTSPTDASGHVGTLGSATLNANFTNRTVDSTVNVAINGQTWNGSATGVPIYRDQYFSAYTPGNIPGAPNPAPFNITCTPNCGIGAQGSLDGFFAGRTGQRAGILYNMGGVQGAVAFGRRGGPGG